MVPVPTLSKSSFGGCHRSGHPQIPGLRRETRGTQTIEESLRCRLPAHESHAAQAASAPPQVVVAYNYHALVHTCLRSQSRKGSGWDICIAPRCNTASGPRRRKSPLALPQRFVMRNITVAVSDAVYRDARVWAAQHGTSISATVQRLLEHLPTLERAPRAAGKADRTPAVAPLADTVSPSRPPTPPQAVIP